MSQGLPDSPGPPERSRSRAAQSEEKEDAAAPPRAAVQSWSLLSHGRLGEHDLGFRAQPGEHRLQGIAARGHLDGVDAEGRGAARDLAAHVQQQLADLALGGLGENITRRRRTGPRAAAASESVR